MASHSSGSCSNTGIRRQLTTGSSGSGRVLCDCGKVAIVRQSWTNANPGRRFYRCGEPWRSVCDFFRWYDLEKPQGWQKRALLEARDVIAAQEEEMKRLRMVIEGGYAKRGNQTTEIGEIPDLMDEMEKKIKELQQELEARTEKEKRLKEVVVISVLGFLGVVATWIYCSL